LQYFSHNQEPLVVKDKFGRPADELGLIKSLKSDNHFFPSVS